MEGWMAVVNAILVLDDSTFKGTNWVLLPEDLIIRAHAGDKEEDSSDEEKGVESPESQELSWQIDFHVVVLDDDQPRTRPLLLAKLLNHRLLLALCQRILRPGW